MDDDAARCAALGYLPRSRNLRSDLHRTSSEAASVRAEPRLPPLDVAVIRAVGPDVPRSTQSSAAGPGRSAGVRNLESLDRPPRPRPGRAPEHMASAGRRHGLAASLRMAAARAGEMAYLRRAYVWYWLRLSPDVPGRLEEVGHLELIKGGEPEWWLVQPTPSVGLYEARRRLAAGTDLWMVLDRRRTALSCWVYWTLMTVNGRRCALRLPHGTVGLENAAMTGRGRFPVPSPSSWSLVACTLAREGANAILAKADEPDLRGRRAIEAAGFIAVASMEVERIGVRLRVDLRPYSTGGIGSFLARQLVR